MSRGSGRVPATGNCASSSARTAACSAIFPCPCARGAPPSDYGWTRVSGRGFVYSYVIVRHPVHPAIAEKEQTPYNVCMIEMEEQEGLRLCSNVLNVAPEDIHIDMPVQVAFFPAADDPDVVLPVFLPVTK